jgi:hypothetical protein
VKGPDAAKDVKGRGGGFTFFGHLIRKFRNDFVRFKGGQEVDGEIKREIANSQVVNGRRLCVIDESLLDNKSSSEKAVTYRE